MNTPDRGFAGKRSEPQTAKRFSDVASVHSIALEIGGHHMRPGRCRFAAWRVAVSTSSWHSGHLIRSGFGAQNPMGNA
jgi:hypothetical protein